MDCSASETVTACIGRPVLGDLPHDGAQDLAMVLAVEIAFRYHVADAVPGAVVEQQTA